MNILLNKINVVTYPVNKNQVKRSDEFQYQVHSRTIEASSRWFNIEWGGRNGRLLPNLSEYDADALAITPATEQ